MVNASLVIDEVTRVSIALLLKEPFYAHIFSCLNKEVVGQSHTIDTLAVGCRNGNHVLYINEVFWQTDLVKPEHRLGVVKHEVLHIVLKHTLVPGTYYDNHVMNIAMDIVVNQLIDRINLPEMSIFLESFPELELKEDMSWTYYYEKLIELRNGLNDQYKGTIAAENFSAIKPDSYGLDRHAAWQEVDSLSDLDKSMLESTIDYLIALAHEKTSHKSWGELPLFLKRYLESILYPQKSYVDWRRALKLFAESSKKTYLKNTLKRPSRRYGTIPGIKVKRKQKLLVAIDTSGSVSGDELQDFFKELFHIYRSGAEVKVIECDAEIKKVYDYKGVAPGFVMGNGGTDFTPPVVYGNKMYLPDALIYFTDGYAPPPSVKPRFPILWIISKDGVEIGSDEFKMLEGRKVKMINKKNGETGTV